LKSAHDYFYDALSKMHRPKAECKKAIEAPLDFSVLANG